MLYITTICEKKNIFMNFNRGIKKAPARLRCRGGVIKHYQAWTVCEPIICAISVNALLSVSISSVLNVAFLPLTVQPLIRCDNQACVLPKYFFAMYERFTIFKTSPICIRIVSLYKSSISSSVSNK